MESSRRSLAYIGLGAACAAFTGAGITHLDDSPLLAALLLAQVVAIASAALIARDARRSRDQVALLTAELLGVKGDLADLRSELAHIDEHTEMVAARTQRLANLLEVTKAVQPPGGTGEETGELLNFPAKPRRVR
ncbi:hypothetical protein OWR29_25680 [Actinoplanes sp. Pm04-4]|uniref:Uncharacterized protein n=1 Tax=Paractinoplanes pyxinae TaxID=2997416 RepID=A0ABT4B4J2_9ACTN|nr:hypothetical protein [Actinoplanes pyxinae]MCY1141404.1 hypothetical protein [Actinoplanes pyxinae]